MMELTKFVAPIAAPYLGYGTAAIFLVLAFVGEASGWAIFWLSLLSLVVGIFVTLCGVIYYSVRDQINKNEAAIAETNRLMNLKLERIAQQQSRMFGMLMLQAVYSSDGDKDKLAESIRTMIEAE